MRDQDLPRKDSDTPAMKSQTKYVVTLEHESSNRIYWTRSMGRPQWHQEWADDWWGPSVGNMAGTGLLSFSSPTRYLSPYRKDCVILQVRKHGSEKTRICNLIVISGGTLT